MVGCGRTLTSLPLFMLAAAQVSDTSLGSRLPAAQDRLAVNISLELAEILILHTVHIPMPSHNPGVNFQVLSTPISSSCRSHFPWHPVFCSCFLLCPQLTQIWSPVPFPWFPQRTSYSKNCWVGYSSTWHCGQLNIAEAPLFLLALVDPASGGFSLDILLWPLPLTRWLGPSLAPSPTLCSLGPHLPPKCQILEVLCFLMQNIWGLSCGTCFSRQENHNFSYAKDHQDTFKESSPPPWTRRWSQFFCLSPYYMSNDYAFSIMCITKLFSVREAPWK